jgi:hypothetical protein
VSGVVDGLDEMTLCLDIPFEIRGCDACEKG